MRAMYNAHEAIGGLPAFEAGAWAESAGRTVAEPAPSRPTDSAFVGADAAVSRSACELTIPGGSMTSLVSFVSDARAREDSEFDAAGEDGVLSVERTMSTPATTPPSVRSAPRTSGNANDRPSGGGGLDPASAPRGTPSDGIVSFRGDKRTGWGGVG